MKRFWILLVVICFSSFDVYGLGKTLHPIVYGLNDCISDIQRYYVLQEMHNDAAKLGCNVSYEGIDTINIEIPRDAKPLPLTDETDFGGVVMNVKNTAKGITLFTLKNKVEPLDITWEQVQKGILPDKQHDYLILIEDQEPWVKNRIGYKYGHTRRDILLVKNGKIQNKVVASYGTKSSKPKFSKCDIKSRPKYIRNLTVNRDTASSCITYILKIDNQNEVQIEHIKINTPAPKDLYGDAAISMNNCTNVVMKDVTINGTYSQNRKYGYGISLNNTWNTTFERLWGYGNWGVFGNSNVNTATLVDCDINRFDIHCYGKDVYFKNCTFRDLYNQYSSVYGTISYDGCLFSDFLPVLIETSYNAYTGFDLKFKNCKWEIKQTDRNVLIYAGKPFEKENERPELKEKCWPNLNVDNISVLGPSNLEEIVLFQCAGNKSINAKINYIKNIRIHSFNVWKNDVRVFLSNYRLDFVHKLVITENRTPKIKQHK